MKKYINILILFVLLIGAIFINREVSALLPLSGITIVIDPGHGGKDPGTIHDNIFEKDINLSISKYLELELSKVGASVILTRDNDYDLSYPEAKWRKKSDFDNRINLINNSKANLYLSIHLNYLSDSSYNGIQVFYDNDINKEIAMVIQNRVNEDLNNKRKIKKIPSKTYMYDKLEIPGVLIECGFLSNPSERAKLIKPEHQQLIAKTIKDALIDYF